MLRLRRNFWQRAPTFLADHRNRVTASTPAKCHAVAPINHTFICTHSFRPSTPLKTGNPKGKMLKMLLRTPSIIDIVYPFRMGERTSIMELLRFGEKGGSSAPSPHLPTRQPSSQQPQIFKVMRLWRRHMYLLTSVRSIKDDILGLLTNTDQK